MWKSIWAGLKIIREWHPQVIHTHFAVPAGAPAWLLNRLTGVPYVLTAHLGDVPAGLRKDRKWFKWVFPFTPPIWKRAAAVVAVSEFTRQLALKSYPVDVGVIPKGRFAKDRSRHYHSLTILRVSFCGTIHAAKEPTADHPDAVCSY
jgi:hypothetical protein